MKKNMKKHGFHLASIIILIIIFCSTQLNINALESSEEAISFDCQSAYDSSDYCEEAANLSKEYTDPSTRLLIVSKGKLNLKGIKGIKKSIYSGHGLTTIQFKSVSKAVAAKKNISDMPKVRSVEFDRNIKACFSQQEDSKQESQSDDHLSWGTECIGSEQYESFLNTTGEKKLSKIVVAVVDTGVELNHPLLKSKLVAGYDFVSGDKKPNDRCGHGTHVAGIIADCTKNLPSVSIMPIKALNSRGEGNLSDIANGILYASIKGASVINMSLSGDHDEGYLDEVVTQAIEDGSTVVASSGNDGVNISSSNPPCPAHMSSVVTVGAIDRKLNLYKYSNYGKALDLVAPGVDIYSSYLNNSYTSLSGTSMATPYVSAIVAMLKLHYGKLSNKQIKSLLYRICNHKDNVTKFGKGIVDLRNLFKNISKQKVSIDKKSYTYSGQAVKPSVSVVSNSYSLFKDKDYSVKYSNNKEIGTGNVTIKAKGSYSGKITIPFKIKPPKTSIASAKRNKRSLLLKWKKAKNSSYASGYQIRYSTKSSMKDPTTVVVEGYKHVSKKLTKLNKNKRYYVQIRTYKKVSGSEYYSGWSKVKTIKVKSA